MSERDLLERLHLLSAELEALAERVQRVELEARSEVDELKIDLETVRRFIDDHHPEFAKVFPSLRESVLRTVDPEFSRSEKSR